MLYVVKIIHLDYTDVPPARSLCEEFTIELSDEERKKLVGRAKKLFRKHSDGNDEGYVISCSPVGEEVWTTSKFKEWLDGFAVDNHIITQ